MDLLRDDSDNHPVVGFPSTHLAQSKCPLCLEPYRYRRAVPRADVVICPNAHQTYICTDCDYVTCSPERVDINHAEFCTHCGHRQGIVTRKQAL